jgi:hypothetical protein
VVAVALAGVIIVAITRSSAPVLGQPFRIGTVAVTVYGWQLAPSSQGHAASSQGQAPPPPLGMVESEVRFRSCRTQQKGLTADLMAFSLRLANGATVQPLGSNTNASGSRDTACLAGLLYFPIPQGQRATAVVYRSDPPTTWKLPS